MNTLIPSSVRLSSFAPSSLRRFAAVVLLTLLSSAKILAAGATPQQVVVTNPVEVLGSVEIVGEPFKQPFATQQSTTVSYGYLNGILSIPLPPGKRIVIETMSVSAQLPVGAKPVGWVSVNPKAGFTNGGHVGLQFQEQGVLNGKVWSEALSHGPIRLNTDQQSLQVYLYRVNMYGEFKFTVSVFGYIESL